jgi:leader peptidase (prepilin peptidase)/N-methyltransferase
MDALRVTLAVVAALPAGWLALVFADRVPGARPLFRPWPHIPFPRGLSLGEGSVYPLTGLAFLLAAWRFEEVGYLIAYLALFTSLIALSVIDMQTLRLPDRLVFPSVLVGAVAVAISAVVEGSITPVIGALTGAVIYFGVLLLAHLLHPAGMGFGDVKLAFLMGMALGWPTEGGLDAFVLVVWAMLVGFGLGSVIGIAILVVRGRSAAYPFGPFLAVGAAAVMLLAPDLLPDGGTLAF